MTALPKAPSTTSSGSRGCPRSRLALDPRRGSCGSSTHHPGIPRLPGQLFSVCQCFLSPCFQRHNTHECGLGRWPGLPTLTSSHLGLWGVGRKSLLCTGCLPPCAPSKPSPSLRSPADPLLTGGSLQTRPVPKKGRSVVGGPAVKENESPQGLLTAISTGIPC